MEDYLSLNITAHVIFCISSSILGQIPAFPLPPPMCFGGLGAWLKRLCENILRKNIMLCGICRFPTQLNEYCVFMDVVHYL